MSHSTYSFLRAFEKTNNGRGMWLKIIELCEGTDKINSRLSQANSLTSLDPQMGLIWEGEYSGLTFMDYASRLQ